jgi:ferredoxin-NADP reductase
MVTMVSVGDVTSVGQYTRIVGLHLDGAAFEHSAGQAVLVGSPGMPRQWLYSIASPPELAQGCGRIELLVSVRRSTPDSPLFRPGRLVMIEGPLGSFTFPIAPPERRFVFIAGGTGIAPVRSMLTQALFVPYATIAVLYSARTSEDFPYEHELQELALAGRLHLRQTVTREAPNSAWRGSRGRFGQQDLRPFVGADRTLWFICGPDGLVRDTRHHLLSTGIAVDDIRTDGAAPRGRAGVVSSSPSSAVDRLRRRMTGRSGA